MEASTLDEVMAGLMSVTSEQRPEKERERRPSERWRTFQATGAGRPQVGVQCQRWRSSSEPEKSK